MFVLQPQQVMSACLAGVWLFPLRLCSGGGGGSGLRWSERHSSAQHQHPGLQRPRPTVPSHPRPPADPRGRVLGGKSRSRFHHRAHWRRPRCQRRGHPVAVLASPALQIQRGEFSREDRGNVVLSAPWALALCCRMGRCWLSALWIGRAGKPTSWWLRPQTKAAHRGRWATPADKTEGWWCQV